MQNETIELHDGRKLGYRIFGPATVTEAQQIILYFVGTPGTRNYVTATQIEQLEKYRNICFISLERPGFGLSTTLYRRSIIDYPKDVAEFAEKMNITKCSILGYSGGGPFALACAYKLPDLITNVITVCSLGPRSAPNSTKNMYWQNRLGFLLGHYSSSIMKYLIHSEAKDFLTDPPTKLVAHYAYNKTDSDFLKENKIVLDMFVDCGKDCYENGQDVEEAWEYHLFANDWKFDVKDIKVPVSIWWGELDTACVPSMGQYLAKEIPNARSHAIHGVSHMVMFTEFENILKEIVQQ